jgi:hypothetical protein
MPVRCGDREFFVAEDRRIDVEAATSLGLTIQNNG